MQIITRKEAIKQGLKRYFTGKPCKYGHIAERWVADNGCVECRKKYYEENKDKIEESLKKYLKENKDKIRESRKKYREENKDKIRESQKKYREENKYKYRSYVSNRRAKKKKLTPPPIFQDREAVLKLYKTAKELSEFTGKDFHVDHIWPLAEGGVHHACNLQVLEASTNMRKRDRHNGKSGVSYDDFMLAVRAYA